MSRSWLGSSELLGGLLTCLVHGGQKEPLMAGRKCRQAQRFGVPCALATQFLRNNEPPKATKHRPA